MTETIIIIVFLAITTGLGYMVFFGFDRMLKSSLGSNLQPGESVAFESQANRGKAGFTFMFSLRQGNLIVTNLRLLTAWWVLPPFWKTVHVIPISDIDKVTTLNMFGMTQVHVNAQGNKFVITPFKNRLWPFAGDKGQELVAALQHGTDARFASHESTGFKDYIRSQVERK